MVARRAERKDEEVVSMNNKRRVTRDARVQCSRM